MPPGVAADASYEKGSSVRSLLQIVEIMAPLKKIYPPQRPGTLAPIWIPKNGHDPSGEEYVMISCPECLRAFPQVLGKSSSLIQQTGCAFCHSSIEYAIVQVADPVSSQVFQGDPGTGMPAPLRMPEPRQ